MKILLRLVITLMPHSMNLAVVLLFKIIKGPWAVTIATEMEEVG